jgi:hypothetical protein
VISVCRIPILVPPQAVRQYIRRGRGLTFAKLAECSTSWKYWATSRSGSPMSG